MISRTLTIARKELIPIVRDGRTLVVDLLLGFKSANVEVVECCNEFGL